MGALLCMVGATSHILLTSVHACVTLLSIVTRRRIMDQRGQLVVFIYTSEVYFRKLL